MQYISYMSNEARITTLTHRRDKKARCNGVKLRNASVAYVKLCLRASYAELFLQTVLLSRRIAIMLTYGYWKGENRVEGS